MSDINVTVTNAGSSNVTATSSSSYTATVGSGGAVNVAVGTVSPGNATVVAGTLTINSTTTLNAGQAAYAKNVGTAYAASLDLGIPAGPATTVQVGNTTTLDSGNASVTGTTNGSTLTLAFAIPRGANGTNGVTPTITASASTLSAGSNATVTATTTNSGANVALAFGIPAGAAGSGGGATLSDATPSALGTAAAGTSSTASRSDHTHSLPVIAYGNLSGVPTSFSPTAHTHSISEVANLQAVLDSKQAAGTYVTLDGSGKISSSVLPSYVDDVIEAANYAALPATGEGGKLYVAVDTRKLWRWSGTGYVEIASSPGSTDSVTEGSTNLYFTTKRAADAAPVQSVNGKTGAVTIEAGGIAWSTVPTATTTVTKAGSLSYDDNYLYVANATNQWRRVGVEDWTTPTISISVQPSDQTAVSGSATFSVTATATQNAELLYQWQRQAGGAGSWVNIATGLSATLSLDSLAYAANNGDKYRVVITSGAAGTGGTAVYGWLPAVVVELTPTATLTSDSATLTISASISIISQPQNVSLTNGTSAAFSVSATTPGTGLAYQWQSSPDGTNWTNVSGATSASYALAGITETGYSGLRYRCIVSSSGYPDATSNAATLAVAPITVTTQPASQTGQPVAGTTPNYSASFTSAASSPAGAPTLQWEVSTDGGTNYSDLSGQTSSSLALTGLTNSDTGKRYRAKFVKSGWNTVRSSAATLTVPTDTITVTQQPSNTTASVSQFSSTAANLPSGTWNDVSYANGKWFATANDALGGDYIATSDDGVTWTKRIAVLPYAGKWSKVLYGNGIYLTFLATDTVPGTWCATSSDGTSWTARQISATENLAQASHAYLKGGGGWFFASNNSNGVGARWVVSQDGISWTVTTQATSYAFSAFNISEMTESADGSQIMAWSPGGVRASIASVTSSGVGQFVDAGLPFGSTQLQVYKMIHDGTTFVAVSITGTGYSAKYISSPNGGSQTWTYGTFSASISGIAYRNSRYVAATLAGLASSNDGLNWVLRQSGSGFYLDWVVATSSGFAGSTGGYIYTSPDGLTWTQRSIEGYLPLVAGDKVYVSDNSDVRQSGKIFTPGGLLSASFSSSAATTFGSPAIQWQQSSDGGATWSNITSATSPTLSLTPVSGDNGKRYRAVYSKDSYTTVNSNPATLTVP
jgi:hypothetical protein